MVNVWGGECLGGERLTIVKDLGQIRQAANKDTGNEQKLVNGKESQEVKIEPKDKFKQSLSLLATSSGIV